MAKHLLHRQMQLVPQLLHLKLFVTTSLTDAKQINGIKEFDFGKLNISSVNVKSKLIWLPDELTKKALLTWQVEIQPKGTPDYWLVNVDALKGNVISKINLNVVCDWTHPKNSGKIGTQLNTTDYTAVLMMQKMYWLLAAQSIRLFHFLKKVLPLAHLF